MASYNGVLKYKDDAGEIQELLPETDMLNVYNFDRGVLMYAPTVHPEYMPHYVGDMPALQNVDPSTGDITLQAQGVMPVYAARGKDVDTWQLRGIRLYINVNYLVSDVIQSKAVWLQYNLDDVVTGSFSISGSTVQDDIDYITVQFVLKPKTVSRSTLGISSGTLVSIAPLCWDITYKTT